MEKLISRRDTETTVRKFGVFNMLMGAFLMFNLVIRFSTIFYYPPYNTYIAGFFVILVSCCIFVILFPKYLKVFLFVFGCSFFLFGFGSIDIQSRVFELIVTCVATTLFVINWKAGKDRGHPSEIRSARHSGEFHGVKKSVIRGLEWGKERGRLNRPLVVLILCYVMLSLFSLLLLPVRQIVKDFWFFSFPDSIYYMFISPPYMFYYPVAAVIRLMLFVVLAVQISATAWCQDNYKWLFSGIFSGAVFCAFIGLLDFYGIVPLAWYRFGKISTSGVLHSTFGNRGWFAEFILTVVPFVLVGFMSNIKGAWWKILLFGSLVISLILAGARAGWVSYPLILFICWLFFYFSKEVRLGSFHFRWRDLIKVVVSVPITMVLSFVLIFQILMPLSDYLKEHSNIKGIQQNSKATSQFMQKQAGRLFSPSKRGRLYTWGEGYNVGRENPLFGMSYESFCWHANILADVPESYCNEFYPETRHIHQTPHNVFFSIFASGGIIGLCLWLLITVYAVVILTFDLIRNKRLLNTPVIISIISFHIFGIFQSMQYIPMIWLLIFLSLGYAMTMDEAVLPVRVRRVMGVVTKVSMVLVVIGFFVYLSNFESRVLADKYGLKIYAMDQDWDRFGGFFQPSKRWKYGDYRWFGKRGSVTIAECGMRNAELEKGKGSGQKGSGQKDSGQGTVDSDQRVIELEFYCQTPGVEEEPVILTVFHKGKLIDEISFAKKGSVKRRFELKAQCSKLKAEGKQQTLLLEVSRTWIPHEHLGNFDRRKLGMGVRIISGSPEQ